MAKLRRSEVTSATVIMLPAYVGLFLWIGTAYVVTPLDRLENSPALNYANQVADIRAWGFLFLSCAAGMVYAILAGGRGLSRYVLLLGMISLVVWAVLFVMAAIKGGASPGAGAWPSLAACACFASYRSLTRSERSNPTRGEAL